MSTSPVQARPRRISISAQSGPFVNSPPRSPSLNSLQAAAAINAGMSHSPVASSPSGVADRRRASLLHNLNLNNPALPGPGEMQYSNGSPRTRSPFGAADPQHHRAPSLGQLHQDLENEQEAQVNRLLHMIRDQQNQIAAVQAHSSTSPSSSSEAQPAPSQSAVAATPPRQPISRSTSNASVSQSHLHQAHPHSPAQRPAALSRQSSRGVSFGGPSNSTSPALRPMSSSFNEEWSLGGTRDESAFYQAETQNLTRENQMLKQRIRELERQINEANAANQGLSVNVAQYTHSPTNVSPLVSPPVNQTKE